MLLVILSMVVAAPGIGAERWQTLPPEPAPVAMAHHGYLQSGGARLYYATTGTGSPVLLLHGALGSSDDWGYQVKTLARRHKVIVMDSRGQGRSTRDARPFSYDSMGDDVVALLDKLKIARVDVVGWSDGANIGIDLAMCHPDRIGKLFAFGANARVSGLSGHPEQNPIFPRVMARMGAEYARLSSTPKDFDVVEGELGRMWEREPDWSDAQLAAIKVPVWIVDGDHEEFIKREHTEHVAATIPGAAPVDPAQRQPFRAVAGSGSVQCRAVAVPRRDAIRGLNANPTWWLRQRSRRRFRATRIRNAPQSGSLHAIGILQDVGSAAGRNRQAVAGTP